MNSTCPGKCGKDTSKSKEEQLSHLKECRGNFELKIKEIDEAIAQIEQ